MCKLAQTVPWTVTGWETLSLDMINWIWFRYRRTSQ